MIIVLQNKFYKVEFSKREGRQAPLFYQCQEIENSEGERTWEYPPIDTGKLCIGC